VLGASGAANASRNVPNGLPRVPFTLHHAFVVYDAATGRLHAASNAMSVRLQ